MRAWAKTGCGAGGGGGGEMAGAGRGLDRRQDRWQDRWQDHRQDRRLATGAQEHNITLPRPLLPPPPCLSSLAVTYSAISLPSLFPTLSLDGCCGLSSKTLATQAPPPPLSPHPSLHQLRRTSCRPLGCVLHDACNACTCRL